MSTRRVALILPLLCCLFVGSVVMAGDFRLPDVFGNPSGKPERGRGLPPEERRSIENRDTFLRLRESARLAHLLGTTYQLRAMYVNAGACAAVRGVGISGLCEEPPSGESYLPPEANSLGQSDEGYGRRLVQESARWRDVERAATEEVNTLCASSRGNCSTKKGFSYWKVENGEVINEDVEMLNLAARATEERLITHILGTVVPEDNYFSPAGTTGDPKKAFEALEEIRFLPNLPVAKRGHFQGEFLPLSSQAANRKRILEEAGLGNIEAIK